MGLWFRSEGGSRRNGRLGDRGVVVVFSRETSLMGMWTLTRNSRSPGEMLDEKYSKTVSQACEVTYRDRARATSDQLLGLRGKSE